MAKPELVSVETILKNFRAGGPWYLPLAQRAFEWDKNRVTNLLDSLLLGYPIGSILIAKSRTRHYSKDSRVVAADEGPSLQILDGQQRCTSLYLAFDGIHFSSPRKAIDYQLWINVFHRNTEFREFHPSLGRRFHFFWLPVYDQQDAVTTLNALDSEKRKQIEMPAGLPESGWIPFRVLHQASQEAQNEAVQQIIEWISPISDPDEEQRKFLVNLVRKMKMAYVSENVPVILLDQEIRDDEIGHLHQIFIRMNTGGLPLSGIDAFFSGVKRYIPDAESHISRILKASGNLLDRKTAITICGQAAGWLCKKPQNLSNLELRHLASETVDGVSKKSSELATIMEWITPENGRSDFLDSVTWVCQTLDERLYGGSQHLSKPQISGLIQWKLSTKVHKKRFVDTEENYSRLLGFAFWSTFLNSRQGRRSWDRKLFKHLWQSGSESGLFRSHLRHSELWEICYSHSNVYFWLPKDEVPEYRKWTLENDRREGSDWTDDWLLVRRMEFYKPLFLAAFQKLRYQELPPLDWDHIVAQNIGRKVFRAQNIKHWQELINSCANTVAIEARMNRVFQDIPTMEKLPRYKKDPILTCVNISPSEAGHLLQIGEEMNKGKAQRDVEKIDAMLRKFVSQRSQHILEELKQVVGPWPSKNAV